MELELPEELWSCSDKKQFDWLNNELEKYGWKKEDYVGCTWHHTERPGVMQLVPMGIHNITNHDGGRSPGMWAYAPR